MPKKITVKTYNLELELPLALEECSVDFFLKFSKISELSELELIAKLTGLTETQVKALNEVNLDNEIFSTFL